MGKVQTIRLLLGDCLDRMQEMPDNSIGAVVTDSPYFLAFMGKDWDSVDESKLSADLQGIHKNQAFHQMWLKEAFRVLKPGGIIKCASATRTFHRLAKAMEEVGFVGIGMDNWIYGCLSEDTEILTREGWVHYHRAKVGTETLGFNPETNEFSWQEVMQTYEYPYDDIAYHIHGHNTDQIVSRNHKCLIRKNRKWRAVTAEALPKETYFPYLPDLSEAISEKQKSKMLFSSLCQKILPKHQTSSAPRKTKGSMGKLCCVRKTQMVSSGLAQKSCQTNLFLSMQWGTPGTGVCQAWLQRQSGLEFRSGRILSLKNDRTQQSCLEGRGDLFQNTRQLQGNQVYPMSPRISGYGSKRRICNGASVDCCKGTKPSSNQTRMCSPYQSRPDRQSDRKSDAVFFQSGAQTIRGKRIPSTAMARVEPVHYKGTVWCVKVPTGFFVARRNGKIFVTGNSGFPKSLNIGKALDKMAGKEREVVGRVKGMGKQNPEWNGTAQGRAENSFKPEYDQTIPASDLAKKWEGYGTALKPAWEPFLTGRKPE